MAEQALQTRNLVVHSIVEVLTETKKWIELALKKRNLVEFSYKFIFSRFLADWNFETFPVKIESTFFS